MIKLHLFVTVILLSGLTLKAQDKKAGYPEPEFSNEVTFLKKDSIPSIVRLEKGSSKMETKSKMGGFAGSESGYLLEGKSSPVRIQNERNLSFVYSTGKSSMTSAFSDSMMRANGVDPSMVNDAMNKFTDPANLITLYKVETGEANRKILMQKNGGAMPFASKKAKSSDKFNFSVKKLREGYWILQIDKSLPRGEYAFTLMSMGSADGTTSLFAFGVD